MVYRILANIRSIDIFEKNVLIYARYILTNWHFNYLVGDNVHYAYNHSFQNSIGLLKKNCNKYSKFKIKSGVLSICKCKKTQHIAWDCNVRIDQKRVVLKRNNSWIGIIEIFTCCFLGRVLLHIIIKDDRISNCGASTLIWIFSSVTASPIFYTKVMQMQIWCLCGTGDRK